MSEKETKVKGYWETSAAEIKMDNIDSQLYTNDSVDEFLNYKFFIAAEKGIGKTLMLKKKKYDLLNKRKGLFIPSNREDLDLPQRFQNLSRNVIAFLEREEHTTSLWSLAIQLSAIKTFYYVSHNIPDNEKNKFPETFIQVLESEGCNTPSEIFHNLIEDIPKILQNIKEYGSFVNTLYSQIHTPIHIFIDRLDQAMLINETGIPDAMWHAMQTGLLKAAWDLKERCQHIKIFCSIRKEAYNEWRSEVKSNLCGQVCFLNYSEKELHELVNKLAGYYEGKGKTIENIVGLGEEGEFIHCKTGNKETVFRYMLRHTVAKPRDLIRIAYSIAKKFNGMDSVTEIETRIAELRDTTNEAAAKIAEDIFTEKARFLGCLQDEKERNRFFSLIPKNTLNQEALYSICRTFNKIEDSNKCNREQCLKKSEDSCKHPFCELYNIGLLGYVRTDNPIQQVFKEPDADIVNNLTGLYSYYVVHPSLHDMIKNARNNNGGKYIVTPGITIGKSYPWGQRDSDISELIDLVLNARLPKENEKEIMQRLKDTIKDTIDIKELSVEIEKELRKIKKKVFLSYCGKDEIIVNEIDNNLRHLGLDVTRDKRDLLYKADVEKFMQSLKEHDYVITVISDSYLKSKNCMYEIGQLLEMDDYKSKTLQIILPDAKIFNDVSKYRYFNHWTKRITKLREELKKNLNGANISLINKDIKDYDNIISNLPKFLEFIRGEKGMLLTDLRTTGYQTLLDHINMKKKR